MNFNDIGIIIHKKLLTENSCIISIMSHDNGLCLGIIRKIAIRDRSVYQIGNFVKFQWQARLREQLGQFMKCELIKAYSYYFMNDRIRLYAFNSALSVINTAFHTRDPSNMFFNKIYNFLDRLLKKYDFIDYIALELDILKSAGYGLELSRCAVTNHINDLAYVSPKSGRAISKEIGSSYAEKLLKLPIILNPHYLDSFSDYSLENKLEALTLTGYFLKRYLSYATDESSMRKLFINLIM